MRAIPRSTPFLTATLALAVTLAFPVSAGAATLSIFSQFMNYNAGAGEDNAVVISREGANYVITDAAGITITPTAPCTAVANVGRCPVTGATMPIDEITADLGDLDDTGS